MKNREKFRKEIVERAFDGTIRACEFTRRNVLPKFGDGVRCYQIGCNWCRFLVDLWLDEEYEEPEIDWNNVPVDTLVRVREREDEEWLLRYFKGINDKQLRRRYEAWESGATSKTAKGKYWCWNYCELVEDEDDGCN